MATETIGLVGVGLLGTALAERLLRAGYSVLGFDVNPQRCQALRELGGRPAASLAEVAQGCGRLLLSLPSSPVVEAVVRELGPQMRAGMYLVDTTTGDPERTALLGTELNRRGIHYLDATISGSSEQVRSGEAVVMTGGEPARSEQCADLFASFAREWFNVGPWGSGARMKLVVNLVLGLNRAVLAEGLSLARACGLDLAETLQVLRAGAAFSRVMDTKGPKMIAAEFQPQARLAQHLKDVRLILAEAERVGAVVPLSQVHQDLLQRVEAGGWGEEDNSAVIRAYAPESIARK